MSSSTSVFPQWPKPVIEANGDYCLIEEELNNVLKDLPLYQSQSTLPHLPVPSIQSTIDKFIPTALPLAEDATEVQTLLQACQNFSREGGDVLQSRLMKRCNEWKHKNSSWLQKWWNQIGYLQLRDPIVVNVSYFFQLKDDPTIFEHGNDSISPQAKRGASILYSLAEYRKMVCSGSLPPETIRKRRGDGYEEQHLCSGAYPYMFHSCRIPNRGMDTYKLYDPSLHRHVIVASQGQFYSMDFVDRHQDGLPITSLQNGLQSILNASDVYERQDDKVDMTRLGILTSYNRDEWADARDELVALGGVETLNALKELESGAVLLCLDDETPTSLKQCADLYWTGGRPCGHNRWYDKSIQIIVTKNGKVGYVGEHSLMDGMPAVGLCQHLVKRSHHDLMYESNNASSAVETSPRITNVFERSTSLWKQDKSFCKHVLKATNHFHRLIDDNKIDVQSFYGYGSTAIKGYNFSPDAWVQTAIQLATYRLFGTQVATYESSQTRLFCHGRTETTRAVSTKSNTFVKKMGLKAYDNINDRHSTSEKISLLRAATESHSTYLKNAASGHGVDRHFFGLQMLLEEGEETPSLFNHPLYLRSKHWRASTSTLPNKPGFGCVVPDGVGIAYDVQPHCIFFTIACRKENDWTETLSHLIEESLLEMRMLLEIEKPMLSRM